MSTPHGRPLRPDPHSYEKTGVPVGRPERYRSHAVIRMASNDRTPFECQQLGVPGRPVESEAERQIHVLLESQLDKSISSTGKRVMFHTVKEHVEETEGHPGGLRTLEQYNNESTRRKRQCEEARIGNERVHIYNKPGARKRSAPVQEKEKKKEKEEEEEKNSARKLPSLSRHAREIEAVLVNHKPVAAVPLRSLTVHGNDEGKESFRSSVEAEAETQTLHTTTIQPDVWEESAEPSKEQSRNNDTTDTTDRTPFALSPSTEIQSISEETIQRARISVEEIQSLPRFADYHPGVPSNILYIKNLGKTVKEETLVSLFLRFQRDDGPLIHYKLIKRGPMRDRAFVEFENAEVARRAMELVNGFVCHGSPLIIQYGRRGKEAEAPTSQ